MKRVHWMKRLGLGFAVVIAVAILSESAWADPVGTASTFQFVNAFVFNVGEIPQQTFRTTDVIGFRADYFDPNPACQGVAPILAQLFLFTAEGLFVGQFSAGNGIGLFGANYRGVFTSFASAASIPLAPGSYAATFLVRDCTNTKSIVVRDFLSFAVVAP